MGAAPGSNKNAWKAPRVRPNWELFCGLWVFLSNLLAGKKIGIHALSTAKSMNYPVGALSLLDKRELRNRCKSDRQLLCVIGYTSRFVFLTWSFISMLETGQLSIGRLMTPLGPYLSSPGVALWIPEISSCRRMM